MSERKWVVWRSHNGRYWEQIGWLLEDEQTLGRYAYIKQSKTDTPIYLLTGRRGPPGWQDFPSGVESEEDMKKYIEVLVRMS